MVYTFPNSNKGEPNFSEVENLGRCSRYPFWSTFEIVSYKAHFPPTGCVTVPKNDNGELVFGGIKFHYDGWKRGGGGVLVRDTCVHLETNVKNTFLFPVKIKGKLDSDVTKKLGMSQRVII